MSAPETVADVTAEMRRLMPHACSDWADRIDRAARPQADTLRDWFAGQALSTTWQQATVMGNLGRIDDENVPKVAAGMAYMIADAMLLARGEAQ